MRFIRMLPHSKGKFAGQPFTVLPWQEDYVRTLLRLDNNGKRIVTRSLLGVARKQGKSEIGAALALTMLVLDGEAGAEVVGAAGKRDQARLVFDVAKKMVRYGKIGGRPLSDFLVVRRDAIYMPETDSKYYVVSADGEREHGLNPSTVIFDELHVQGTKTDLWDALVTAQGARENPLLVSLTTAGPQTRGLCYDEYQYGLKVNAGIINDPSYFMRWYEADKNLAIDDPKAWAQANPSMGHTVPEAWLAKAASDVLSGRASEYVFRRLHLNQFTNALERWLDRRKWEAGHRAHLGIPDGAQIWIGMDAALRRDSFGVSVMWVENAFIEDESGLTVPADIANVRVKAFLPEEDGDYIDQEDVRLYVMGLARMYKVQKVLYDPAYMTLFAQQLADAGLPTEPFPQSPERMIRAAETLQRLVLLERFRWTDKVLDDQLSSVGLRESDRGVRIAKSKSGRVDTVISTVMCLDAAFGEEEESNDDFAFVV